MPSVRSILSEKGVTVHSIAGSASVFKAVELMNKEKLGALIVMNNDRVAGIFTERDVLQRVVGERLEPTQTKVENVMTREVICVAPDTDLDDVSAIMKQRRVRHLPVCDDQGKIHGFISIGDVNAYYASNRDAHITFLSEYIYGRV